MENIQIWKKKKPDMRLKTYPKSDRLVDLIYFRGIHKLLQKPDWSQDSKLLPYASHRLCVMFLMLATE